MRRTPVRAAQAIAAAGALALVTALTGLASAAPGHTAGHPAAPAGEARGFYDVRRGTGAAASAATLRTSARASARPATRTFRTSLGRQALLDMDGTTGTVRLLEKLDGYLTGKSSARPARIVKGYLAAHHDALGLTAADLRTFHQRRNYRDVAGTHHLSWVQVIDGTPVFGNGLQAAVTRTGRLLTLGGSPVSTAVTPRAGATRLATPGAAISAARADLGEDSTTPGPRDTASRVLFVTRRGTFLGWQAITMSAHHPALTVLDSRSGRLLLRRPLGSDARSAEPTGGTAFRYFPGHRPGGRQVTVNYARRGWLGAGSARLFGNNAHAYSDLNDDNRPESNEEATPSSPHRWDYPLKAFHLPGVAFCDHPYPCSWDPDTPYSWRANRKQNVAQVFYFVNQWHDHLQRAPIGFTEAAGNFQMKNRTGRGQDGDPVDTQTDDGANTDHGLPDGNHIDNANMDTPPDGQRPTMQMYLQHQPGTSYPDGDPWSPTNVGDEADTVYHEYTHGLSNRLVVDATGNSTLGGVQAGAMGEAWSDWYAMDYLVRKGLQQDRPGQADVVFFQYDGAGVDDDRTEPLDCRIGSTSSRCTGGATGHRGGYSYADYAHVIGLPEVHADGEIWSQTLWSLRARLGSGPTEALVTRAMELAPGNPSFLDLRNALLVADTAVYAGAHHDQIWRTFAHRGMGFYAGSLGGDDTAPAASFKLPPVQPATAYIRGVVRDADSGAPVAGAPVTLAFQGGHGAVNPGAVSGPDGAYRIGPVPVGRYGKLVVSGAGYDTAGGPVRVTADGGHRNFRVRRDWAASSGGATISDFSGPDYSPQCGPPQAIDNNQASGWSSTAGDDLGTPTNVFVPKHLTVDLGVTVDVAQFGVDPSATCGDGGSASTGDFRIETSPDGSTWTVAEAGSFTAADRGRVNLLTPAAGAAAVRYVRFTMLGNQTPDFATSCPGGAYSGCSYADLTELEVYGAPSR